VGNARVPPRQFGSEFGPTQRHVTKEIRANLRAESIPAQGWAIYSPESMAKYPLPLVSFSVAVHFVSFFL
jgi:hypothetical protein